MLISELPDGVVVTDPDILASYRQDRAADPGAGTPLAVVRPTRTEEVQTVLRWAGEHRVAVVPRGAGTGLSGGATALNGGIVLSTEKMRDITVDPVTRTAVVQPGLLNAEVKKAVAAHGLWYPPDPSSFEICSIGGNVATNAGGLCCVKYGVTTDYVLGLQVVLADGTAVRLGGPRLKDVAGLSLTKLFVGSEGTLGVVTEATLRLLPPQNAPCTVVATFDSVQAAAGAVVKITGKIRPSMLEFMDSVAINAVEDKLKMGLDRNAAAMMVAASDDRGAAGADDAGFMAAVFTECGATEVFSTSDPDEGEAFVAARRFAIPAVEAKGSLLLEDVGVPLPALAELVSGVAEIAAQRKLLISVIAHAGDGNTHPLIVFDPADTDEAQRAQLAFGEIMDLAIGLGGTITGEHGVGRLKRPWLAGQIGPDAMELNQRIKRALDPHNILNPGAAI
ncbi:FAD-binding oxidoreductase [Mycolicibacterium fortuitum]|uniref:FAD-linked oxidase C-terminal domain-containing protein n=2 Tax=Mycolicibacterium fortuitum TaxID=1766 RepID=A0AAE4VCA3_MYCFO|nr:FAD-linked oxidase C-terminal domain-containing protein [Mycolicibacterium fortuitum]MCA4752409.1 FAD-binding protein [Mycolicibacterium fortuitum]MCV7141781.1 FAD-binding protein [Mycolicibacterium fortuitum]MDG5771544.1 FAD-linked oxidase C-terminal domain-containing protein [Mycolicibacterium fortuitum]MDG5780912.1 FAD-linked oxidase C-terminal domain-containing protein [Mycolicibacterium fortuitum]MDV7190505.1 FAD-linked oxidase C-terminal domain-containing protein [Mycolicibacterium fo